MFKPPSIRFGLPRRQPTNLQVNAAPEVPSPQEIALPKDADTAETMARTLEATGNYKILRRLVPRTSTMAFVMPVKAVMAGSIGADGCWNPWKVSITDVIRSSA